MKNNILKQKDKIINQFKSEFIRELNNINKNMILDFCNLILKLKKKNKILIFGNGAGQSIADHFAVDIKKNCDVECESYQSTNHITCYSNDYGFNKWMLKTIEKRYFKNDLIIFLSASGKSENINIATKYCLKKKIKFVTISGFKRNNLIKERGLINFWFKTDAFNIIESLQNYLLLMIVDLLKGKIFYSNKI